MCCPPESLVPNPSSAALVKVLTQALAKVPSCIVQQIKEPAMEISTVAGSERNSFVLLLLPQKH